jgi:pimeloyl-ACP methyl ester carboxylesterase
MRRAPFQQLPFADVPDAPRQPHGYFATDARDVVVETPALGRVRTHVRVHGAGPPLLLVHGFMTSSYSWRYALAPLGARFTLYVPDLPGAGRSDKPDRPYTPEALAEHLGALVDVLGLRGAPAIGNSLGGYLCMQLALRDPRALSRLVNLHSPGVPTVRMRALRVALDVLPGWKRLVSLAVRRDPEHWVHRNVHYFDETLKSREEHREYAAPLRTDAGLAAFLRMLDETVDVRAMARFVRTLRSTRFPIPLQLVYARRDPMVPPSVGARLARLVPGAELVWLDQASHFAHVDATERFADAVLPFLTRGLTA